MKKATVFGFFILFFLTGCTSPHRQNPKTDFRLQIIHVNDTHSHIEPTKIKIRLNNKKIYVFAGGYAKIGKFIKQNKNSHTLVLHAGDAVQGTLYYTLFKGKADVDVMNKMGFDAMCVGNHEWDNGAGVFAKYFAKKAEFPIIACDVNVSKNKFLKNIIKPFVIKKFGKEKVAVVGDTIDASVISNPGPTVKFCNYLKSAEKYVNILKRKGINKIIFLTHLGFKRDVFLAKEIPDIDVIVGGHSHTLLGNFKNLGLKSEGSYPVVIKHKNSLTLVVTAWKWGLVVGDLNVTFNKKGVVTAWSGTPVMLVSDRFFVSRKKLVTGELKRKIEKEIKNAKNIQIEKPDVDILNVIARYKPEVQKLMNKKIGIAEVSFLNKRIPDNKNYLIAPLVARALYIKAKRNTGKCDFALINAGALRCNIPKGVVTLGEIYNLLPFGNTLVIVKMKGTVIKRMLQNAIKRALSGEDTGAFPYVYPGRMIIKNAILDDLRIYKNGKWENLKNDKYYYIATNSYLANGGDYYSEMKKASKYDTGFVTADVFINYIKKVKTLKPERIFTSIR